MCIFIKDSLTFWHVSFAIFYIGISINRFNESINLIFLMKTNKLCVFFKFFRFFPLQLIRIFFFIKVQLFFSFLFCSCCFTGSAKYNFFFWILLKKKLLNIFSNFFFYLKVRSFGLIIENNFIQMAALAGHAAWSPTRSVQFLGTLSIVFCCISPMASRILSYKAPIVSGLSA